MSKALLGIFTAPQVEAFFKGKSGKSVLFIRRPV